MWWHTAINPVLRSFKLEANLGYVAGQMPPKYIKTNFRSTNPQTLETLVLYEPSRKRHYTELHSGHDSLGEMKRLLFTVTKGLTERTEGLKGSEFSPAWRGGMMGNLG